MASEKVTFHMTRELATMADYMVSHQSAAALPDVGGGRGPRFDGVIYPPRFHVSATARGVALYGARKLEVDDRLKVDHHQRDRLADLGIDVREVPPAAAMPD